MLVKSITEEEIYGIGHAFGYYDCGEERGNRKEEIGNRNVRCLFRERGHCKRYLCLCARGAIKPKGVLPGPSSVTELPFLLHKPQCEVGGVCRAAGK